MQIEDVKTWHWVVAGLLVGLAFSAVMAFAGPAFATAELDTMDAAGFEHALLGRSVRTGEGGLVQRFHRDQPLLQDVVVHPPVRGSDSTDYWVTGELYTAGTRYKDLKNTASGQVYVERWVPFKYPAPTPYVGQNGAVATYPNVTGYLAAMKGLKATRFDYRFAWPETPAALWTLPPLAGLLTVGVAWPLALGVMQSAGMARPPRARPVPKPVADPVPVPRPAVSTAGVRLVAPPPPPSPKPVPVGDDKEYGGEFYPVVKKGHHD